MSHIVLRSHTSHLNASRELRSVGLAGLGWSLPEEIITNDDVKKVLRVPAEVEERNPTTTEWMVQHMGVRERRWLKQGETNIQHAVIAAKRAMETASIIPEQIDRVVVATVTPESHWPTDAALISGALGLKVGGDDQTAACSSLMNALENSSARIRAGFDKRILLIGMDAMAAAANPFDRNTFPLFGDAATAWILENTQSPEGSFWYFHTEQLPELASLIGSVVVPEAQDFTKFPYAVARGLRRVSMNGNEVFKQAVRLAVKRIKEALEMTGLEPGEFKAVCLHQANDRITEAVKERLGFEPWQIIRNISRFGNTTSASVPLCLAEAWCQHMHDPSRPKLEPGDKILMISFGAGFTIALAILEWSEHFLQPQDVSWTAQAVPDFFRVAA